MLSNRKLISGNELNVILIKPSFSDQQATALLFVDLFLRFGVGLVTKPGFPLST